MLNKAEDYRVFSPNKQCLAGTPGMSLPYWVRPGGALFDRKIARIGALSGHSHAL
jgi:hypothetical protein